MDWEGGGRVRRERDEMGSGRNGVGMGRTGRDGSGLIKWINRNGWDRMGRDMIGCEVRLFGIREAIGSLRWNDLGFEGTGYIRMGRDRVRWNVIMRD